MKHLAGILDSMCQPEKQEVVLTAGSLCLLHLELTGDSILHEVKIPEIHKGR